MLCTAAAYSNRDSRARLVALVEPVAQPLFSVAVAIAAALRIPVADLAGMPTHRVKLSGEWWASWQTFRNGVEKIATQKVEMQQEGSSSGSSP